MREGEGAVAGDDAGTGEGAFGEVIGVDAFPRQGRSLVVKAVALLDGLQGSFFLGDLPLLL